MAEAEGLQTAELLKHLCEDLGREDTITVLVKKIVSEQKIRYVENLREVPPQRLEEWGVPLKLISHIGDWFVEHDAHSNLAGLSGWFNYSVRPAFAPLFSGNVLLSTFHKHIDPEDWAARKLQGAWRSRKCRRQIEQDKVLYMMEAKECQSKRMTEEEEQRVRLHRAEETLRRFIRRWRLRRAEQMKMFGLDEREPRESKPTRPSLGEPLTGREKDAVAKLAVKMKLSGEDLIANHCLQACRGQVKQCSVVEIMEQCTHELGHDEEETMASLTHRIITLNWLEDTADLGLITGDHWERWDVSEHVSSTVRQKYDEHVSGMLSDWAGRACNPLAFLWGGNDQREPHQQGHAVIQDAEEEEGDATMGATASRPPDALMRRPQARGSFI